MSKRETSASLRAASTDATVLPKSKRSCESETCPRKVSSRPRVVGTATVPPVVVVASTVEDENWPDKVADSWGSSGAKAWSTRKRAAA
jgi:hypothetical protein